MRTACAWCRRERVFLKGVPVMIVVTDREYKKIPNHGICPECYNKMMKEIKKGVQTK